MLSIVAKNINDAFTQAMVHFRDGVAMDTLIEAFPRDQRRWQYPYAVSTTYLNPMERVLFDQDRDCNPFFHFMESLWILAGRNDVAWLSQWLKTIGQYSDDGVIFHGAYGDRINRGEQLKKVIHRLRTETHTTRAVLQIYDHFLDADYHGKDLPCNTMVFLGVQNDKLNLTVANRSNDMIWGAYGANVVQFSMLQEYIAGQLGCGVGWYTQMSNNAHIYPDTDVAKRLLAVRGVTAYDPYDCGVDYDVVVPYPLGVANNPPAWEADLKLFMYSHETSEFTMPFFKYVAKPMQRAHLCYRVGDLYGAHEEAQHIQASDWRLACCQWINRRITKASHA